MSFLFKSNFTFFVIFWMASLKKILLSDWLTYFVIFFFLQPIDKFCNIFPHNSFKNFMIFMIFPDCLIKFLIFKKYFCRLNDEFCYLFSQHDRQTLSFFPFNWLIDELCHFFQWSTGELQIFCLSMTKFCGIFFWLIGKIFSIFLWRLFFIFVSRISWFFSWRSTDKFYAYFYLWLIGNFKAISCDWLEVIVCFCANDQWISWLFFLNDALINFTFFLLLTSFQISQYFFYWLVNFFYRFMKNL